MVRIQRIALAIAIILVGCAEPISEDHTTEANDQTTPKGFIRLEHVDYLKTGGVGVVFVDVRKPESYRKGHIPGAIQVYRPSIQRDDLPYPGVAISRQNFEKLLGSLGIHPEDWIVAYDDKGGSDAARFCWLAKRYGHRKAIVLDGGLNYYEERFQPDTIPIKLQPTHYQYPDDELSNFVATVDDVINATKDCSIILLDTRSFDEYSGKYLKPGASRSGHIPGAVWFDWGNCVRMNDDYLIKDVKDLKHMLDALNITKQQKIITYCHTGVRSAHTMTVLQDVLGYPHVRNYDGSWCEWSYMNELPISTSEPNQ